MTSLHTQSAWGFREEKIRTIGLAACYNYLLKKLNEKLNIKNNKVLLIKPLKNYKIKPKSITKRIYIYIWRQRLHLLKYSPLTSHTLSLRLNRQAFENVNSCPCQIDAAFVAPDSGIKTSGTCYNRVTLIFQKIKILRFCFKVLLNLLDPIDFSLWVFHGFH